jgi:hypothetical protein
MNLGKAILKATKISNAKELESIPATGIKNAIWRNEKGVLQFGEIGLCDHCKTPYYINVVNVISVSDGRFDKLENTLIEECTCEPENDYKCMFCNSVSFLNDLNECSK